jgi:hypothetical protein
MAVSIGVLAWCGPAMAETPPDCRVAENLIETSFPLAQVSKALAGKRLDILVVGAGSSILPGASGATKAFPARLQNALAEKLPAIAVKVATDLKAARSAAEMVSTLKPALAAAKPALMIWQTGTVDAVRSVEPDQFNASLEQGIAIARTAGADVILMNMQFSPRTESMIALGIYIENMRWVALQHEFPLFDRFSIMKLWAELGTFDLYSATKKLDTAERVHDCIGRLLADLIVEASKPGGAPPLEIR